MTSQTPRPLYLHSLESLCADLVSGRSILVSAPDDTFSLESAESRAILNWYWRNLSKWESDVRKADVEAIVAAAVSAPPAPQPQIALGAPEGIRHLRLVKVQAHRFAGLHTYGTWQSPPNDLSFEPETSFTLLEGDNGSGKTSLINTIVWCLTGEILRPQRPPERATDIGCRIENGPDVAGQGDISLSSSDHKISPITPVPDPRKYRPSVGQAVPTDTWVELTFVDDDGEMVSIRRSQFRDARDRLEETSNVSVLRVDPVATRIGTVIPALIPYVQLGSASELGQAVAKLTGLSSLVDLERHARRVAERVAKDLRKEREAEIVTADQQFTQARDDLLERTVDAAAIAFPGAMPLPSVDPGLESVIANVTKHFEECEAQALASAKEILGDSFDPQDKAIRRELIDSVGPAQGRLTSADLPSATRLKKLGTVKLDVLESVEQQLQEIRDQADVLAQLAENPPLATRKRLYAKVTSWIKEEKEKISDHCPVCTSDLQSARDPVTGELVRMHLDEALQGDSDLLSKTMQTWVEASKGALATRLPDPLKAEMNVDLPAQPSELLRKAYLDELLAAPVFSASLIPLKKLAHDCFEKHLPGLPKVAPLTKRKLPSGLGAATQPLAEVLHRLERAIQFARWRREHWAAVKALHEAVVGTSDTGRDPAERADATAADPAARLNLTVALSKLAIILDGAEPVTAALELCQRMSKALVARRQQEKKIVEYERTATAIRPLAKLGELAQRQVDELRERLKVRTAYWRDRVYRKTHSHAYELKDIAVSAKGALGVAVGREGVNAPAQHVSNASALRASLMGFFLAFWEHVLKERGGLKLIVLDDPQELLDNENRDRLADSMLDMLDHGAQLVVTTCDRAFAREAALRTRRNDRARIEHRSVVPITAARSRIQLPISVDGLEQKRKLFELEENQDIPQPAQDYAAEVRVFVEARLCELFDDPAYATLLSTEPSFSDLVNRLRGKANRASSTFFTWSCVTSFVDLPALAAGSRCLDLLNRAHHGEKHTITYMDVDECKDDLKALQRGSCELHEEYFRWRKREPEIPVRATVIQLKPVGKVPFRVELLPDLAAYSGAQTAKVGAAHDTEGIAELNDGWFDGKSAVLLRTDNFGFAASRGSIAIIEEHSAEIEDRRLVIAFHGQRVFARRLLRPPDDRAYVTLTAETPNPIASGPTLRLKASETQVHRVVGIFLNSGLPLKGSKEEAVPLESIPDLRRIKLAFKVRDTSALPLALPGQIVLGGRLLIPQDLDAHRDKLVAIALEDRQLLFKRVSDALPPPLGYLRNFESIGGLGQSSIVQTEEVEGSPRRFPVMKIAIEILGILYHD